MANRGYAQYPLPRRIRRQPIIDNLGLRLVAGVLGLFWTIIFGAVLIALWIFLVGLFLGVIGA